MISDGVGSFLAKFMNFERGESSFAFPKLHYGRVVSLNFNTVLRVLSNTLVDGLDGVRSRKGFSFKRIACIG
jgi:hypothetical protein